MTKHAAREKLSKIWLFGALALANRKIFLTAFYEFAYLVIWTVLPFALGGLVRYLTAENTPTEGYIALSIGTLRNGELLVATISLLAPTLYLINHEPDGAIKPFFHKLPLSTIVILVMLLCASLFSLQKAGTVRDANTLFLFSVIAALVGLFLRYLAMVYYRVRMPTLSEKILRSNQEDFVESYEQHVNDEGGHAI